MAAERPHRHESNLQKLLEGNSMSEEEIAAIEAELARFPKVQVRAFAAMSKMISSVLRLNPLIRRQAFPHGSHKTVYFIR